MAINWTGIKRANEETASNDDITPVANSGSPGDVVVGESTVFVKTTMYGDKWLTRFDTLPKYSDPFKRGYVAWHLPSGSADSEPCVERFLFANETAAASIDLGFSDGYCGVPHPSSSSKVGYMSGGYNYNASAGRSTIRKSEFSVETDFTSTANLTQTTWQSTGPCSSRRGYRCGGCITGGLASSCDYINFSDDTSNAVAINNLDIDMELGAAFNTTVRGYLYGALATKSGGGYESISTIRRISFATDNQFSLIGATTGYKTYSYANANSRDRGYVARGIEYGVGYTDYFHRFLFATETTTLTTITGYASVTYATTNTNVAFYGHGSDRREKTFFGTDTKTEVCAFYQRNSNASGRMGLDTTDNNGFIFAN